MSETIKDCQCSYQTTQTEEGKIKTCTIKQKNGKYYACFACEIEAEPQSTGKQVGVDLGVKHLAITSDGEFFENLFRFQ
jgi:putative transposase